MHHLTKKKYLAMKEAGMTAEELKAEMLAGGVEEAEADALIEEAYSEAPEQSQDTEKEKSSTKPPKTAETANSIYEEWKMDVSRENGSPVLEKVKKIKDVKMTEDRAARLNDHAENRKIKYFLKQN
jgi:hypothetical protein